MKYFYEIQLLPDPEFTAPTLMNAIFSKLHKRLFDMRCDCIGVSFPEYDKALGTYLRLHGSEEGLGVLNEVNWIGGMRGFCLQSGLQTIPDSTKYRIVSRKHTKKSQSKLRRLKERGNCPELDSQQYLAKMDTQKFRGPYLEINSNSTGQRHRRYIELGPLLDMPTEGKFDTFGLSKTATVPWF